MQKRDPYIRSIGATLRGRIQEQTDFSYFDSEKSLFVLIDFGLGTSLQPELVVDGIQRRVHQLDKTIHSLSTEAEDSDEILQKTFKIGIRQWIAELELKERDGFSVSLLGVQRSGRATYAHVGSGKIYQWIARTHSKRVLAQSTGEVTCGQIVLGARDAVVLISDGFLAHPAIIDQFLGLKSQDQAAFLKRLSENWVQTDGSLYVLRPDVPWYSAQEAGFGQAADAISNSVLFKNLRPEEIKQVLAISNERSFEAGEVVIQKGAEAASLFILLTGAVELLIRGKQKGVKKEAGTCFGEISFLDRHPRSATVKTIERSQFLELSFKDLDSIMNQDPELGLNVLRALGFTAALRLRQKMDSEQPLHPERFPERP